MSARNKLNSLFLLGSLAVAAIAGVQTGSIIMFIGVAALLVGCAIGFGAIRLEMERVLHQLKVEKFLAWVSINPRGGTFHDQVP